MDLETFLALLRTEDRARMQAAARDLGRDLAAAGTSDHRALRRRLAVVARDTGDAFTSGFVDALTMVARGFEAEREDEQAEETSLAAVRTRRHWMEALEQMVNGCALPKDLAKNLELEAPQVTGVLDELEEAGLIVRREPTKGEDQRTRPFRLTARGRAIGARATAARQVAPIEPLVEAVVRCVALLFANGRASRTTLTQVLRGRLEEPLAAAALQHLTGALAETSMALLVPDDSLVAPGFELQSHLDRIVEDAIENDRAPLITRLREIASSRQLVLRVSNRRDEWDVMIQRVKHKHPELNHVEVFRDDDVSAARTAPPSDRTYRILYESPMLLEQDQGAKLPWTASVIKGAERRFIFGMTPTLPPRGFQMIELPTLTIRAAA
jgi:DNA-binding MarR family transcriptional regulator